MAKHESRAACLVGPRSNLPISSAQGSTAWMSDTSPGPCGASFVRPARAHSWRCKSSRKLATANEVKRNCGRVTDRGEEAWSVNREPMDKNRMEGAAEQGERARNREALVAKARRRKSGGCAVKECVLTRGDLA
jgi:hypothetical protein